MHWNYEMAIRLPAKDTISPFFARAPMTCRGARQNLARPNKGHPRSAEEPKKAAQAAQEGRHNYRELLERFGQLREAIQ